MEVILLKASAVPQKIRGIDSVFSIRFKNSKDNFDACLKTGFDEFVSQIIKYCGENANCRANVEDYCRKLQYLHTVITLHFWDHNQSEPFITKSIEYTYDKFINDHLSRVKPNGIDLNEIIVKNAKNRAINSTLIELKSKKIIRDFEFAPYPVST